MSFTAWSSSSSAAKPLRCKMQMLEVWKCFLVAEHPRGHGWLNTDVAIFHMRCHLWNIFSVCGDYGAEKNWAPAGGAVLTFLCVNERKSSSWLWRWIYAEYTQGWDVQNSCSSFSQRMLSCCFCTRWSRASPAVAGPADHRSASPSRSHRAPQRPPVRHRHA